jgi:hypothetical protein
MDDSLPLLRHDRRVREIRRGAVTGTPVEAMWLRAAERQIHDAPDAESLRAWRRDNCTILADVGCLFPETVRIVRQTLEERLAELRDAEAANPGLTREEGDEE